MTTDGHRAIIKEDDMKISETTLKMLRWMATVNGGIKIDPGNEIYTKAESQAMACVCEVTETFDKPFVTTNLSKFLSLVDLIDSPDFEFQDDSVIITSGDGKNKVRFLQSNPALVNQSNKVPRDQPEVALTFTLQAADLQKVFNSAKVLCVSDITLHTKNGSVFITVSNKSMNSSSDYVDIKVGDIEDPDLEVSFAFKKQNLRLINEYDYEATIYTVGLAKFVAKSDTERNMPYKKFNVYVVTTPETK